jgi:hypothetical protein
MRSNSIPDCSKKDLNQVFGSIGANLKGNCGKISRKQNSKKSRNPGKF